MWGAEGGDRAAERRNHCGYRDEGPAETIAGAIRWHRHDAVAEARRAEYPERTWGLQY